MRIRITHANPVIIKGRGRVDPGAAVTVAEDYGRYLVGQGFAVQVDREAPRPYPAMDQATFAESDADWSEEAEASDADAAEPDASDQGQDELEPLAPMDTPSAKTRKK